MGIDTYLGLFVPLSAGISFPMAVGNSFLRFSYIKEQQDQKISIFFSIFSLAYYQKKLKEALSHDDTHLNLTIDSSKLTHTELNSASLLRCSYVTGI